MEPFFSIITATYNAAATLGRTLASVDSQDFADYEHIIVDGASTDGTLSLLEENPNPERLVLSEPDSGLYDAMNKGIGLARGRYLIFLNAGDKFHGPDTLSRLARVAEDNDIPGILYGQTVIVDNDGLNPRPRHLTAPRELTLKSFSDGMVVCHQAFVVLRRIAPFYNLKYRFSADYDWCIQCLQHSRRTVYAGDEPLIDYLDEGLTTTHHKKSLWERYNIMRYYYGTVGTTLRHFRFLLRHLKR